jgi:predicted nucleotidyltransferase
MDKVNLMIEINDQILQEMVQAIIREVDPEKIILFGSQAQGPARPDSDLDLLIVEREGFGEKRSRREELARIRRALSEFFIAKDILVFSQEEVARWRNSINHIIATSLRDGRILYERS